MAHASAAARRLAIALAPWWHLRGRSRAATRCCARPYLRGPGKVPRSGSPELIEQEIWGYLLTRYALSALICAAATSAGIDPDRVRFKRTLRVARRAVGPAFPP